MKVLKLTPPRMWMLKMTRLCRAIVQNDLNMGRNIVIGGGAVASKAIETNTVAVGHPARRISSLDALTVKRGLWCID